MKVWIALFLATPVALGVVAWIGRPHLRHPEPRVATSRDIVEPDKVEAPMDREASSAEAREETVDRQREREKAVFWLEENFEIRILQLIASIDWTHADSRARFPIEYDMIQADFDRSVDAIYRNQPRSFSRE